MQKSWNLLPDPPENFYEKFGELPRVVARLLFHRNIRDQKKIDEFLHPDYSQDIHDPFLFQDMQKAVNRIFKAISANEKIIVHGDYDADGVTASVVLISTLRALGAKDVDVYLPHRETEGYGININTIKKLSNEGVNLIISCDCGISNISETQQANELGMDIIITDHHDVPEKMPPAHAIIHPKVKEEKYPDKGLAGGAVAFKLAQALIKNHSKSNSVLENGDNHIAFEKWLLDMVAIASVADMVPLIGESRTLTKYGLIVLNKTKRIGLQKLLLEARLMNDDGTKKYELDAEKIAFQIAPRINAAGRMNHANVAYKLLITDSPTDAIDMAYELDQNNKERQKMTDELVRKACKEIDVNQSDNPVLFVVGDGWSPGIIGLIASRLKEKYYKPTMVMARSGNEITGSGRSIEGFSIIDSLREAESLFKKYGGHPMACGFTLKSPDILDEFKQKLTEGFIKKTDGIDLNPKIDIDAEMDLDDVDWKLYDILEKFSPFGMSNEKPKYLAKKVTIVKMEPVGKDGKHLRLMVKHNSNKIRKTIGWNLCCVNGKKENWCKKLKSGSIIDIVFEISVNEWNGSRELQLTIHDLKMNKE